MKYLHTMVRVKDLENSLDFYCNVLGLKEVSRYDNDKGEFTLIFLCAPDDYERAKDEKTPMLELTYNWSSEEKYTDGRNFGHLAFLVDNIYATCEKIMRAGVTVNRPPRDGHMAFLKSPDGISIELLQKGDSLKPAEPWVSMENKGTW